MANEDCKHKEFLYVGQTKDDKELYWCYNCQEYMKVGEKGTWTIQ